METYPLDAAPRSAEGMTMENCDMCGSKIIDNECECGTWVEKEETDNNPLKLSLEYFHEMKRFTLTGDAPHLGCAFVYFRGDYNDCQKVQNFIYALKGRPFYEKE